MSFNNNVYITGNLTRDPELRFTKSGAPLCNFGIAWNQRKQNGDETAHFFDCTAWRDLAENIAESFKSGDRVNIQGRLDFQKWETDGKTNTKVSIVVEEAGPSSQWATTSQTKQTRAETSSREESAPPIPDEEPF